jgi:hypothetical protein
MKSVLEIRGHAANLDFRRSFQDIPPVDAQRRAHSAAPICALPRKQMI